ncbi:efflux RND transporter periplasmic adaptor subunit (plasmid) [Ensifer adhaerens]|uniref:efflux RND transporter periplasmic adaptor subunit n=1 Tax=Ensifer adhaerens TaxID=106592 RepID=UPI0023A9DEFD|nr:efflux RND transporter periplasmic adaptor subunit [Ensifer adhaerens]WDZ81040.1 efflux RND transporter periplasmic adaptor subunit [Ensifer adhaerens]
MTIDAMTKGRIVARRTKVRQKLAALLVPCALLPVSAQAFDCVIDPSIVVRVGSPVPGLLKEVLIARGDRVKENQVIARLHSDTEQATVELMSEQAASTSEIEAQKARLELARNRMKRAEALLARNVTSTDKLEEAVAEMEVIQKELATAETRKRSAELELQRAQTVLEQRTIRSPISGVVLERSLFNGEYLDQDGKLATIAKLDPLFVEAFIPVSAFGKMHVGMDAQVVPNAPIQGSFIGKIKVIDQVLDAASGTFGLRIELPNPGNSIPAGHRCTVTFEGVAPDLE